MEILGIIPARGGSKGIRGKNLYPVCGKPLIQYTFAAAKQSKYLSRILLSSDNGRIIQYARKKKVEVPFVRPKVLAGDRVPMVKVIRHMIKWLGKTEGYYPDIIVLLQPTSPLRNGKHIDEAIAMLRAHRNIDSVVSMVSVPHSYNPVSVMCRSKNGLLVPYLKNKGTTVLRRQDKPEVYARNGAAVYVFWRKTLIQYGSIFGRRSLGYIMNKIESVDIDDYEDIMICEGLLRSRRSRR